MWILCTYAEKCGKEYPNHYYTLTASLGSSFAKVRKMFSEEDFDIVVRNIGDDINDCDFSIVRKEDNQPVAEMEFQED